MASQTNIKMQVLSLKAGSNETIRIPTGMEDRYIGLYIRKYVKNILHKKKILPKK